MMLGLGTSLAVLIAGGLIGATGIGGVLLVPALTQLEGIPLRDAVAASSLAFAFPAVTALWWLWTGPVVGAQRMAALVAGAVPGALLGGWLVHLVEARWLFAALAILAISSAIKGLMPVKPMGTEVQGWAPLRLAAVGALVALGSSLTGTGGPVILIPLMMLARQPLALTLASAQVIQLPVALSATTIHAASGARHIELACVIGVILLVGSLVGQRLARQANTRVLQIGVCMVLLCTGLWFAWKSAS